MLYFQVESKLISAYDKTVGQINVEFNMVISFKISLICNQHLKQMPIFNLMIITWDYF